MLVHCVAVDFAPFASLGFIPNVFFGFEIDFADFVLGPHWEHGVRCIFSASEISNSVETFFTNLQVEVWYFFPEGVL